MECPKCQFENPNGFKFCGNCAHPIEPHAPIVEKTLTTGSERKHVTIMFSDLSGYTAMTERIDPEEVKGIMSLIFEKIFDIIKRYDGFIEKFIGDSVMAVFGVPTAHEDDPIRAVRAAIEMHAAIEKLSPRFEEKIGRSLSLHTGINTGLVVTGEVDVAKGTHGLTGDALNLAARLEGIAREGEIVVGPETYQQSLNFFEFETLGTSEVKGKAEPVLIYKVLSVKKELSVLHRTHGAQADLIGRDREMAVLEQAVQQLEQGRRSIISVCGDAGTGKSRLTREFKERLDLGRVQWYEGHAYGYTQNTPYYPLIDLMTHAFQIEEGDRFFAGRTRTDCHLL